MRQLIYSSKLDQLLKASGAKPFNVQSRLQQRLLFGDQVKQSSAPLEYHNFQGTCLRDPIQSRVLKAQFKDLMNNLEEDRWRSRKKQEYQLENCRRGQWDDSEQVSDEQKEKDWHVLRKGGAKCQYERAWNDRQRGNPRSALKSFFF